MEEDDDDDDDDGINRFLYAYIKNIFSCVVAI
jgi:hypothetical protein